MLEPSRDANANLEHKTRSELAATIERRLVDIETRWLARVQQELLDNPSSVTSTELKDAIGEYLSALAKAIRGDASIDAGGGAAWADVAREHGLTRVRLGFDIGQLVSEFILLRKSMVEIAREEHLIVHDSQGERLADLIDAAIAVSVKSYIESRDIATRRQQAEHVGFLTHELRNPLATASMAAGRLRKRPELVAAEGKTLDMLERGLTRLRDLIDKVLLTERFEAQEMECRPVDTSLGRIVTEAVRAAKFEASQKEVAFVAEYDPELLVHVDPDLTSSALQNIVDNAVKFTDRGRDRAPGGERRLGGDRPRSRRLRRAVVRGAEVGLRAVQAGTSRQSWHRARAGDCAPSRGGAGRTHRRRIGRPEGVPLLVDASEAAAVRCQMARILMVNDEKDLLTLCQVALEESGHEVEILTNGAKAVECARRWKPNLMVIDWVMPDMDGHAIMSTLKSCPDTKSIPVLMMSALRDGATRAKLVGANSFLAKPFSEDDLVGAVNGVLAS